MNPIVLIAVPLGLAFLSMIFKGQKGWLVLLGAAANVICLPLLDKGIYDLGGFMPPFGISLVLDQYSILGIFGLNILILIIYAMHMDQLNDMGAVLLVTLAALNGLILTGDLFNLFVFLEIATIGALLIASSRKKYVGVFNYLVIATVGSSLYLMGVVLLYITYGSLNMMHMSSVLNPADDVTRIALLLIVIGMAVEVKLFPVNGWVKGILKNADGFVGTMIGAIYAGVMLLVFGRLFGDVLPLSSTLRFVILFLAVITVIAGEVSAFASKNLREILLFSSIGQSGVVVLLFISGLNLAALMMLFSNVVTKAVLYEIAGRFGEEGEDGLDVLAGVFRKNRVMGVAFTIASLSLIGMPVFFGFYAKMNMIFSLFQQNALLVVIVVVLLAALVEGAYMIRVLVTLWNPGVEGELSIKAIDEEKTSAVFNPVATAAAVALAVVLLVAGLMPSYLMDFMNDGAMDLNSYSNITTIDEKGEQ